jgi:hypothetical protein
MDQVQEVKAKSFDPIPDGNYNAEIAEAEVLQKPDGRNMLKIKLAIAGGAFDGRWVWMNYFLETPQNLGFVKRDLATLGIRLAKWNDLNERAAELVGICVEIRKKTTISKMNGQEYQNIYLTRALRQEEVDALGGAAPAPNGSPAAAAGIGSDPADQLPF